MVFLTPLIVYRPAHVAATPERSWLILRGCGFLGATCFMAGALSLMPLATAVTLMFVGPFIVTALSALLLKEQVGWRRWSAIAFGFAGMLIVVRPGIGGVGWSALLVLGATLLWSLGVLITRQLGGRVDAMTMLVWQAITGFVLAAPVCFATWVTPTRAEAAWLIANGVLNLGGQWLIARALQMAPVATLAPLTYMGLAWATILGWLIFGTLPDGWTYLGAAVIVAAGLYVGWRERVRARMRHASPGPAS
jgi:drug/metabolite transporter (DMT)-like permease